MSQDQPDRPDELADAQRRAEDLAAQVRLLLKTEQRLAATQRALAHQVARVEVVNRLALALTRAGDAGEALDLVLAALLEVFPYDVGLALQADAGGRLGATRARTTDGPHALAPAAAATAAPGLPDAPRVLAAGDAAPWLALADAALGRPAAPARGPRRLVLVPVQGGDDTALLVACTDGAPTSHAAPLASDADAAFLSLLAQHAGAVLESLALRARTHASDVLFRIGFDHGVEGMLLLDAEGRFLRVNAAFARMLGRAPEELIGRRTVEFTHPDDVATTLAALGEGGAAPSRRIELEKRYLRPDGSAVWARVASTKIDDAPGRPGYWFSQITDLTARRNLEETQRLASVGRLAAGVAHEINNPLTYVLIELEQLQRRRELGPAALERVERALDGCGRIASIVRDLKVFVHARAGDDVERVDLAAVVEDVLAMAQHEIAHRGRLEVHLERGVEIAASRGRIAQVVLNLIINAAQALGEGGPDRHRVELTTAREGERALLVVADTGAGIPAEHLGRIFEPFFTSKAPGKGTGLGLSISRSIVESYGGTIAVASEVGRGSRFTLSFPLAAADTRAAQVPGPPAAAEPVTPPSIRRRRVLVVDDDPQVLHAIRMVLDGAYVVIEAQSAAACRERLKSEPRIDVVLCDIMMPGESGVDLFAWMREAYPKLAERMLFMSGGTFTPDADEFVRQVGGRLLPKPFSVERLVEMLDAAAG